MNNCRPTPRTPGCKPDKGPCGPGLWKAVSLAEIVAFHISNRECGNDERDFYRNQRSLRAAIMVAAMARIHNNRHPHQYRLRETTLAKWTSRLLKNIATIKRSRNFHELYLYVEGHGADTFGIGPLTAYDTAHRIGLYLGLEPDYIYLHAGTYDGAEALGLDYKKPWLTYNDLPKAFRKLRPHEIEDCLCIYKDRFNTRMRFE